MLVGLDQVFRESVLGETTSTVEALTGKNTMNCLKYVDFYESGSDVPVASMAYEGDLHILSPQERRALTEQVLKKGQIPQQQIESSRRFGP